ncbi:MAG: NAD-dependent epimerase/dehydratase family protein [bacterium]
MALASKKIAPGTPVLVTGATGFTGSVLIRKLVASGLKVSAIARSSSNIEPFQDLNISWYRGDVFDEKTVDAATKGMSYIFHVAAAYREAGISDETYHNVHVRSTQLLAQKARMSPAFKRFVHVSTVGVHSHIENPPADENYPIKPGDIYQETKAEAELWIRDFSKKEKLPLTVVRPAAILGPGDRRLLKIFKMASKKWFPLLGFGKGLYHLIHVDDLTDFMILAATHPAAEGEVFICGNRDSISLKEMVKVIAGAYKSKINFVRLPAWPFFILGALCEVVCRPLGVEPPIYRRRVAFFTKDRAFNTTKMQSLLGFLPKYDNSDGLRMTAKWYLEQGWLSGN